MKKFRFIVVGSCLAWGFLGEWLIRQSFSGYPPWQTLQAVELHFIVAGLWATVALKLFEGSS